MTGTSPEATEEALVEPDATETPVDDAEDEDVFLIENVPIKSGGIEVFPEPDRESGRLFAALGDFQPHIAGVSEDGEWYFIYYFEGNELFSGWARASRFNLEDVDPDLLELLPIIDPDDLPEPPELEFSEEASRPVGTSGRASGSGAPAASSGNTTDGTVVFDVYDCVYIGNNVFQWDRVQVTYRDGVAVNSTVLDSDITGDWRPGCPAGEQPSSGGGGSSDDSSGDDGSGDDGGGPVGTESAGG